MDYMDVDHITSLLYYHQSNGLAEKYVQLVKSLLYKVKVSCEGTYFTWMLYRKYPSWSWHAIPYGTVCARQARSDLPISHAARIYVQQAATKQPVTRPHSEIIRPTSKNHVQATSNLLPIGAYVCTVHHQAVVVSSYSHISLKIPS